MIYAIYNFYVYNKNKANNTDTSNYYDHSTAIENITNQANRNNRTNYTIKHEVINILKEHPEIISDALKKYSHQKKQEAYGAIANLGKDPINIKYDGKLGDVSVPNKILIFFSYGCSHCVNMSNVIHNVLEDRKDIFVVYKDLPMNSYAAALSHASFVLNNIAPERYESFHLALMNAQNNSNIQHTIKNSISSLGLSQDQQTKFEYALVDKDLTDKFTTQIQRNRILSIHLEMTGTPGLIINNQLIPGGDISQHDLESLLKNNNNSTTSDTAPVTLKDSEK